MDMGLICSVEDFFDELRRNEIYAFAIPNHEISWHHSHAADSDWQVDARQHYVPNGRRIGRTEICRHVDVGYAVQIADAAVHNQTATVGGFHCIVEEIVTHNGAIHLLSEQVDDEDISGLEHVNSSLIGEIVQAALLGFVLGNFVDVSPQGHELYGEGTADHGLSRMQNLKPIRILVLEALLVETGPDFFGRQIASPLDHGIGHLGASIGEPVEWGFGCVVDQFLLGERVQLRVGGG